MKDDPAIQAIRAVRHRISAERAHDPKRLVAYYMELQQKRKEAAQGKVSQEKQDPGT